MIAVLRPTLLLDRTKCLSNIREMASKASKHQLYFRPHFKTHQSAEIGQWFRDAGVRAITVSSVKMAVFFIRHGWEDITIAFPFNIHETEIINCMPANIRINLTVVNPETILFLEKNIRRPAGLFVKIDTGYHRAGISVENIQEIKKTIAAIGQSGYLKFSGFLVHNGHTYHAASKSEILAIHHLSLEKLRQLRKDFQSECQDIIFSLGDTPSCSIADDFTGADEIRPGNFVFYDSMQWHLGSCDFSQIAVIMACPVVAVNKERHEVIIHGGAVHFSKESLLLPDNNRIFGEVVLLNESGWGNPVHSTNLVSLSQEHGIIRGTHDFLNKVKQGDILGVIPVHSCLTAQAMREYRTLQGEVIQHLEKYEIL